ncbi:uncharacterized protein LOC106728570 isoform X2 [Camelus ferus]|uniref:Uncharacterized protein LOC106728570 isoform X2 n=1 Tax=Camelus ferus TaxID=419612 RepID=A0A8B8UJF7_CAMFR|nr:uncharacterized protein LOC106728570 isoform X2 [Camelus ferus]
MEKLESLRAAGGLNGESPGNNIVEAGAGLPSVVVFHGSGPPMHSGGIVTRSPESGQLSEGTEVLGSGLNQHPGEVAGHSLGSGTYPGGTSVFGTSNLGFSGPGMYNSEDIPRSGSTRMYPDKLCEDRPRSILKNSSYAVMYKSPRAERKKSQHWDEMNILATYHPTDKDYGFMTVDEPSTPYHRLRGSDEDLLAGTSHTVTPEELAERFATMDNFCPKILLYGDNRSSGSSDTFSKTQSSDFEKHRKAHYNEGKFLKLQRNLPLDNNKKSSVGSVSVSSGGRGVVLDPEPRPAERGGAGGLTRGVKDEFGLVTRNDILEAKGSTGLNWVIEDPISTEVRLLDHTGSSSEDPEATENSLKVTVTPSKPGTALSSKDSGSRAVTDWCQWLATKGLNWQSTEVSEREPRSIPNSSNQSQHRHEPRQDETLRLRWTQEEETRQWKM